MSFTIHTTETAPEISKPILGGFEKAVGFVPNLLGVFAESPFALNLINSINNPAAHSGLSPVEQRIITVTSSIQNECEYCVSAQSTLAKISDMPEEELQQLRKNAPLKNAKHEALRQLTLKIIHNKGYVPSNEIEDFMGQGYTKAHVIEVIAFIAYMTLANYVSHVSSVNIDDAFMPLEWKHG